MFHFVCNVGLESLQYVFQIFKVQCNKYTGYRENSGENMQTKDE